MGGRRNASFPDPSTLGSLRALIPNRPCQFAEALVIAELQASRLLSLTGVEQAPVPSEVVSELPRISVHCRPIPMSGLSYWNGDAWIIAINRSEPPTRQRFTLMHEFKHIVYHGRVSDLYRGGHHRAGQQAEQAADYFAGCVLMPRVMLKQAWSRGLQTHSALARHFETSERAIHVRLAQVGLLDGPNRHQARFRDARGTSSTGFVQQHLDVLGVPHDRTSGYRDQREGRAS